MQNSSSNRSGKLVPDPLMAIGVILFAPLLGWIVPFSGRYPMWARSLSGVWAFCVSLLAGLFCPKSVLFCDVVGIIFGFYLSSREVVGGDSFQEPVPPSSDVPQLNPNFRNQESTFRPLYSRPKEEPAPAVVAPTPEIVPLPMPEPEIDIRPLLQADESLVEIVGIDEEMTKRLEGNRFNVEFRLSRPVSPEWVHIFDKFWREHPTNNPCTASVIEAHIGVCCQLSEVKIRLEELRKVVRRTEEESLNIRQRQAQEKDRAVISDLNAQLFGK